MDFAPRDWSSSLVYGRLSCPPGLFVQGLETLPPELLIKVMSEYCSINEIQCLISASPVALSCFTANRCLVLGPRCRMAKMKLGEMLPMALFGIRLRHLREKHDHLGKKAVEWLIKHLLGSLKESGPRVSDGESAGLWPATEDGSFGWRDSLPKLAHLEHLIFDTEAMMRNYAEESWEKMQKYPTRYIGRVAGQWLPDLRREPLKLPTTEHARLLESLICLDIYCNAFFYHGEVLLYGDLAFRRLIRKSRTNPNRDLPTKQRMRNFYAMLRFIHDRFTHLLETIDASLRDQGGRVIVPVTKGLFTFMDRSQNENEAFLQYLCSQGYSMILKLEDLKGETQREFVVAIFLHFSSSYGLQYGCSCLSTLMSLLPRNGCLGWTPIGITKYIARGIVKSDFGIRGEWIT